MDTTITITVKWVLNNYITLFKNTIETGRVEIKSLTEKVKSTIADGIKTISELTENLDKLTVNAKLLSPKSKLSGNLKRVTVQINILKGTIESLTS